MLEADVPMLAEGSRTAIEIAPANGLSTGPCVGQWQPADCRPHRSICRPNRPRP